MNTQQTKAAEWFRAFLARNWSADDKARGKAITKFEPATNEYFATVSAEVELTGLPETNLLRALDHEHWFVFIGKRGGLTVKSCPKSFEQFHGRYAFNMKFDVR